MPSHGPKYKENRLIETLQRARSKGSDRTLASFIRIANTIALPDLWIKFLGLNARLGRTEHETGNTPKDSYTFFADRYNDNSCEELTIIRFRDPENKDRLYLDTIDMCKEDLSVFFHKYFDDDFKKKLNLLVKSRKWLIWYPRE
mmetsp:Transcript_13495/g.37287  ORF Transcript_13495/g.37287 Transcript_13495/m.37287 type:complete len:144 (+) Transcript_13495:900-1331(+)